MKVCAAKAVRGAPDLLAPDLLAVGLEDAVGLDAQQRDLVLGEAVGKEDVALLVESLELLGVSCMGGAP